MGKGCKVLLIVGIILFAFLAVGVILSYTYCDKLQGIAATKTVEQLEKDVMANLPEGANLDDVKSTLNELKDKVSRLVRENKVDFTKIAPMVQELGDAMKDKNLTLEELDKIINKVKEYVKND